VPLEELVAQQITEAFEANRAYWDEIYQEILAQLFKKGTY
jgi:hypothetical protein